jgi:DNA mismatch repair protein MLH1
MEEDDVVQDGPAKEGDGASVQSIRRLPVDVVNRIAAGEIIQRPANALKEMMENSLDAGATMIRIQLKEGGLKMLQIQDDGSGVSVADMPLLCERFATSKLRSFSDLSRMTTFGFRGEALASISYVTASMSVISRTPHSEMAYKASYAAGKLVSPKPGQDASPRACAGSVGTFITAEDLFFNVPQRRRALRSANDEYNLALDVVSKYAVHYGSRGIGFSCKKANSSTVDLSVPSSTQMSTQDVIGLIHGNRVAKELIHLTPRRNDDVGVTVEGWISGPNWSHARKAFFLLFINNRLVESPALKRAVTALYATVLPKGTHPWVYLTLRIDEENVDVNVHPTKREVHFLHEDRVIEVVSEHVQEELTKSNVGRSYTTTQTLLRPPSSVAENIPSLNAARSVPGYPQHTVRVDAKARTLEAVNALKQSVLGSSDEATSSDNPAAVKSRVSSEDVAVTQGRAWLHQSKSELESVHQLREDVVSASSLDATEILRSHTLVGVLDGPDQTLLLQHSTRLYAVHYATVMADVAYQLALRRFGEHEQLKLDPAPLLKDLVTITLNDQRFDTSPRHRDRITRQICDTLIAHREMLLDYFSINIQCDEGSLDARLYAIPDLSAQMPRQQAGALLQPLRVPAFVVRLVTQIDYTSEEECLLGILRELATLHVPLPGASSFERQAIKQTWLQVWQPAMRHYRAGRELLKANTIRSLASLPSLYSIFERC